MTTLVSFATRDCIVIGCDSLATVVVPMIMPQKFIEKFFEINEKGEYNLIADKNGKKQFKGVDDLVDLMEDIPYNQVPNVTKIFSLAPAKAGALFAGIASIGNRSIQNIIDEFLSNQDIVRDMTDSYTLESLSQKLFEHVKKYYDQEFENQYVKPQLEILLSGYSTCQWYPEIYRIRFGDDSENIPEVKDGNFDIVFGGQHDVIQRVVKGVDFQGYKNIFYKVEEVKLKYYNIIKDLLDKANINIDIPKPDQLADELILYDKYPFNGLVPDITNFSEQAAIDFVDFLVDIMIKSQQFNNTIPTVGGDIHIAIITKSHGFKWISKEEYKYKNYGVPKHDK